MISWDEPKRKRVIRDHGVDFAKLADLFDDPYAVYIEDVNHSTTEEIRFNVIGLTAEYGLVFVAYFNENEDTARLITARRAENWMVKEYEKHRKRL